MKRNLKVILIILCALSLFACSVGTYKKGDPQIGIPEKSSPALTEFLRVYLLQRSYDLFEKDDNYIYSKRNGSYEDKEIQYFSFSKEELENYYAPLFKGNDHDPGLTLSELYDDITKLEQPITNEVKVPAMTLNENNELYVDFNGVEKIISLSSIEGAIQDSDKIKFNVIKMNHQGFVLYVENVSTDDNYYLFILSDLSEIGMFLEGKLDEAIENSKLEPFYPILQYINDSDRYSSLLKYKIVDTEKNQVINIDKQHVISHDNAFIYIDGNHDPLTKGTQHIQKLEDYLAGKENDDATFELNYKKLSKRLDFKTTGKVSAASIVYFDEDFVVLYIDYAAPITGKAGSTNVIIDLQSDKENPDFYLVDLNIII